MKTCKSLWNRQWILGSLLAAGLLAPCGICRGETVYDAAADLTKEVVAANANPNGPWSYGYRASAESRELTLFSVSEGSTPWLVDSKCPDCRWVRADKGDYPFLRKNLGTAAATHSNGASQSTLRPDMIHMHPGYGDRAYVVVRWTAASGGNLLPGRGLHRIGLDRRNHGCARPRQRPRVIRRRYSRRTQCATNVASCSKTIAVAAGDMIDFAVGPGGNGNGFDSTGLTAKITLVAPASGGTVYDAAADLTKESIAANANPNGPWSYGYRGSAESSDFTPFPTAGVSRRGAVTEDVQGWWLEPARGFDMMPPYVLANVGTKTVASTFHPFSTATLRPGNLYVHPAAGERAYVVVRWTAPASGSYRIDTVFTGMDSRV